MSPVSNIKTLQIDGKDVSARPEETILEVARQHNIFIPRLCELKGLSTIGACRLCLVLELASWAFHECRGRVMLFKRDRSHRLVISELRHSSLLSFSNVLVTGIAHDPGDEKVNNLFAYVCECCS